MPSPQLPRFPTHRGNAHPHQQQQQRQLHQQQQQDDQLPLGLHSLTNRAGESNSPYVRAHVDSLVAWQPLNALTIWRAQRENKLIYLHIGFRACHYCRLASQDSFANEAVASLLNRAFIPIIIDREERPDLDAVYMNYVQAVAGSGGWPLNVFVTPDLHPVFGGTYWRGPDTDPAPANAEMDPDFLIILRKLHKLWTHQEARCRQEAREVVAKLRDLAAEGTLGPRRTGDEVQTPMDGRASHPIDMDLDLDHLDKAFVHLASIFDPINGGFGVAPPKFPTPPRLSFLLRLSHLPDLVRDVVGEDHTVRAANMTLQTLRKIRDGGLRDHIGRGFARYSATRDWSVPHFEKLLPDNALLLGLFLDAMIHTAPCDDTGLAKLAPKSEFADVVLDLVEYLTSEPIHRPDAGFATSEAADSYYHRDDRHMRDGAYYVWTRKEFDSVVRGSFTTPASTSPQADIIAAAHWGVQEHGNVPREHDLHDDLINQNVLSIVQDVGALSHQFALPVPQVEQLITTAKARLRAHREHERVRPSVDDKVVTSYNAMAIASLARTSTILDTLVPDPVNSCAPLDAAVRAANFIKQNLWDGDRRILYRAYCHGRRSEPEGFAEDYAFLIDALIQLHEATDGDETWLEWADELQKTQLEYFHDPPMVASRASAHDNHPINPRTPSCSGGFYSTAAPGSDTFLHLKDGMDTSQPSANAVSASNLFRLSGLLGDAKYAALATETLLAFEVEMLQYPWLFPGLLPAVVATRLGGNHFLVVRDSRAGPECDGDNNLERDERDEIVLEPEFLQHYRRGVSAGPRTLLTVDGGTLALPGEKGTWVLRRNEHLRRFMASRPRPGIYRLSSDGYVPWTKALACHASR